MLMKNYYLLLGIALIVFSSCSKQETAPNPKQPPNILFIAVDDLNDWTGIQGGHPQSRTPNLDQLAERGVFFKKAYCAAPACNPSRVAVMTGLRPSTTGIYYNEQSMRLAIPEVVTMPQYFRAQGYTALGSGKIYHRLFADSVSWDEYAPSKTQQRFPFPQVEGNINGLDMNHFDWGPVDLNIEEMPDYKTVTWVSEQLQKDHGKPFFLACGIYRPHLPWYVPEEFIDQYPLESIKLPETIPDDLNDIPSGGQEMIRFNDHEKVTGGGEWEAAVQGYLASVSFADRMIGKLLEAFDKSPHKDNTIIVLWSDHGWNLGEKNHWRKFALWERTTRVPFLVVTPEGVPGLETGTPTGTICEQPVNLVDIYPTLLELTGLPEYKELDGSSLVPLLKDAQSKWDTPSLTTYGKNNHSLRSEKYRYISYADGTEELYDMTSDPREYTNLAGLDEFKEPKAALRAWLPKSNADNVSFGSYEPAAKTKPGMGP